MRRALRHGFRLGVLLLAAFSAVPFCMADEPQISADALPIINQLCEFYQKLPAFKVNARQVQRVDGEEKADSSLQVTERKPNEAKIQISSDAAVVTLVSDGKSVVLHRAPPNTWYRKEVATNFEELTKQFATGLDVLVSDDVRKSVLEDVSKITKDADEQVNGVPCYRLDFQQSNCTVNCWVAKSGEPVLKRMLIHAEQDGHTLELETQFGVWNTHPALAPEEFAFQPPAGAREMTPPIGE